MLLQLLLLSFSSQASAVKCYSCSSGMLHSRWPKEDGNNRLQFLTEFPWFSNESCDAVKSSIPVVDCPDSVCIKAVIKEPPAKRDVCVESGAVVRDCWSRVVNHGGMLNPKTKNNILRMIESPLSSDAVGFIYTCKGFLCNSAKAPVVFITFVIPFYLFQ